MHRNAIALLAGLVCAAALIAVVATAEQRPLIVAVEAAAIGLLTYALTFAVRPRRPSGEQPADIDPGSD